MDTEKASFLRLEDSSEPNEEHCYSHYHEDLVKAPHKTIRYWAITLLAHAIVLFTTLTLTIHSLQLFRISGDSPQVSIHQPSKYSPIHEALQYEQIRHPADAWSNSIYTGNPSHESDAAWNKLAGFLGVTITDEENEKLNLSTLPVKGGHATVFGFNHNIHCIRFLRQVLHTPYYYPHLTPSQQSAHISHAHHCLETIRLSVMCVPDLTPLELYWENREGKVWEIAAKSDSKRECVKWTGLEEWMWPRHWVLNDLAQGAVGRGGDGR